MDNIDAIRGIAALAVVYFHIAQYFIKIPGVAAHGDFLSEVSYQLNLGFLGVLVFFAISGFVICPTLKGERANGVRRFIISRFFRLFPAFWASMLLMIFVSFLILGKRVEAPQILGNIPMLFSLGFILTFLNGGITGLFLGNVVVDVPLSDTMFVVAHFHMVMGVAPILVIFGAIYHWYPLITGRMLHQGWGQFHFWVTFVGAYLIYFPMHYLGFLGVPRRYYEIGETDFIPDSAQDLNAFITVAALVVGFAQMVFIWNLIASYYRGKKSERNPWQATTLEWQTADFPPTHGNWGDKLPVVYRWAYAYGVPGAADDYVPQNMHPDQVAIGEGGGAPAGAAAQPAE